MENAVHSVSFSGGPEFICCLPKRGGLSEEMNSNEDSVKGTPEFKINYPNKGRRLLLRTIKDDLKAATQWQTLKKNNTDHSTQTLVPLRRGPCTLEPVTAGCLPSGSIQIIWCSNTSRHIINQCIVALLIGDCRTWLHHGRITHLGFRVKLPVASKKATLPVERVGGGWGVLRRLDAVSVCLEKPHRPAEENMMTQGDERQSRRSGSVHPGVTDD